MSSPTDRPIRIEVTLRSFQPELLEGLDVWLRLGLISEAQVRLLCTKRLTCPLPQPTAVTNVPMPPVTVSSGSLFLLLKTLINLSIANIALGLSTQLLGEVWRWRHRVEILPSSCHILPLIYGVLGGFLRWGSFTGWTGLCSLGIALIAIGVWRRRQEFKPLLYLGLLRVSVCAYELLFYQFLQAPRGALGDRLIAMSVLGTSIIYADRVLSPWLIDSLCLTAQELKIVAHLHWIWSSCLLIDGSFNPIAANQFIGLRTGVFLIQYAIFLGRHHPHPRTAEIWVYLDSC